MLIDKDRVSVRVHHKETGRPRRGLVRLLLQLHPSCLQLARQFADTGERGQRLSGIPAKASKPNFS